MKKVLLIASLLFLGISVQAQTGMGISLKAYAPKAAFNQNVDKVPFGISFNYQRSSDNSRFSWGGELGVAMYSSDSYDIMHRGNQIRIDEEDCFFTLHGFVRYDLVEMSAFKLYSEARLGLTTFFSTTDAALENTGFDGEFSFHGTAFNMGAGIGLMVNPGALFSKDRERDNLWINMGINGHSGSRATYRMHPEGDGVFSLEEGTHESLTHYFGYKLGVIFGI